MSESSTELPKPIWVYELTEEEKRSAKKKSYALSFALALFAIAMAMVPVVSPETRQSVIGMFFVIWMAGIPSLCIYLLFRGARRVDRIRLTITEEEIVCTDTFRTRTFRIDDVRKVEIDAWDEMQLRLPLGKSHAMQIFQGDARKPECLEEITKALGRRDERRAAKR